MRRILTLFILLSGLATLAFPKDVFLSIGGSVGAFRTDMRIFNPSSTKDIQVQAYLLPIGGGDNSGVQPKTITVPKRQQMVFDDVVTSLFQSSGLAGIRLSSTDDFVATQRIYAGTSAGTLGQFVGGVDSASAKKNGVLIQLKSNAAFRTNIGMVNPGSTTANTTWRLYDKNNALVGTPKTVALPPYAVISPQELRGYLGAPAGADLSDAWLGYTSDQPIVAYASCVDNGTTDPTYIAAVEDSSPPTTPTSTNKVLSVVEHNNRIDVTGADVLVVGDVVTVRVQVFDGQHGFQLLDPAGKDAIPSHGGTNPGTTYEETFTVTKSGTYAYFCTNSLCGAHDGMFGTFSIGDPTDPPKPGY
jgi:plastocyanin